MEGFNQNEDTITIDGEKYYHHSYGGKYTSTKFIVINQIHYYNAKTPSVLHIG